MLGYGLQDYMMGGYNPYMMGAYSMMNQGSYLNFKNENDMKNYFNTKIDDSQSALYASGQGRISQRTQQLAQQLHGALKEKDSSEAGEILNQLKDDKYQLAGLERVYDSMYGSRTALRQDIRNGMEGNRVLKHFGLGAVNDVVFGAKKAVLGMFGLNPMTEDEAISTLNAGAEVDTVIAANALKDATNGPSDKETLNRVLSFSGHRMNEIGASYSQMGSDLNRDIRKSHYFLFDAPAASEKLNTQISSFMANA